MDFDIRNYFLSVFSINPIQKSIDQLVTLDKHIQNLKKFSPYNHVHTWSLLEKKLESVL
jgi:hypothetical protein